MHTTSPTSLLINSQYLSSYLAIYMIKTSPPLTSHTYTPHLMWPHLTSPHLTTSSTTPITSY